MDYVRVEAEGIYIRDELLKRPDGSAVAPVEKQQQQQHQNTVRLNVYNLHWANRFASKLKLGAFHSELVVFGMEFSYGYDDSSQSGISHCLSTMRQEAETVGTLHKSLLLGYSAYTQSDLMLIVKQLGRTVFTGSGYDILTLNCNHFTQVLSRIICPQAQYPAWVNSLARVGAKLPLLQSKLSSTDDVHSLSSISRCRSISRSSKSSSSSSSFQSSKSSSSGAKEKRQLREVSNNIQPSLTVNKKIAHKSLNEVPEEL